MRVALGLLAALLCVRPASAIHRQAPGGGRVTSGAVHALPPTRSWNYTLAFPSDADLAGTGSTSRQVFVWNARTFAQNVVRCRRFGICGTPRRSDLVQITETGRPGSPDNGSANARWVTFDADGSYGGGTGPQASRRQIFLYDVRQGALSQVTSAADGDSVAPSIDLASGTIVFESTASLAGTGPPGVRQVFAALLPTLEIVRITAGAGPSRRPVPDRRATRVVFESTADLDGDGADTGTSQIFVATRDVDPRAFTITRVTRGNAGSRRASIDKGGRRIVFESDATNLGGEPGGTQVYVAGTQVGWVGDASGSNASLRQITRRIPPPSDPGGPPYGDCFQPDIDTTGFHLAFVCTADFLQNGTSGNRLFTMDLKNEVLGQLTARGNVVGPVSKRVGRFLVAFASDADVSGTAACGAQIQLVNFFAGNWDAAHLPGELPPDVLNDMLPPVPTPPAVSTSLAPHCDDGNLCTIDRCDPVDGCVHVSRDPACNDGDPCTADACQPGVGCQHVDVCP